MDSHGSSFSTNLLTSSKGKRRKSMIRDKKLRRPKIYAIKKSNPEENKRKK
jgi:hypothetical protein